MPIMAVSSGIFAVPEALRPPVHFVTMDYPKWFFAELHEAEAVHAWQFDQFAPWAFWANEHINKHVPDERINRGWYRSMPAEVWDVIPEQAQEAFRRQFMKHIHQFSYQPGWGDFSNVHGWPMDMGKPPRFDSTSPIGMAGYGGDGVVRNSWFMAVQIAYKLGYRRAYFIGCDFGGDGYKHCRCRLGPWYELSRAAGMEWINLGQGSALADVVPTETGVLV